MLRTKILTSWLSLAVPIAASGLVLSPANAQVVERHVLIPTQPSQVVQKETIIEQTQPLTTIQTQLPVAQTQTTTQTTIEELKPMEKITTQSVMIPLTPPLLRSNYDKRLGDLEERIGFALSKGWLSEAQAADFRSWASDCEKEVAGMRTSNGGIVSREDVDQVERHINGLAYMITQKINANIATTQPQVGM
jgi:hypothetical protein